MILIADSGATKTEWALVEKDGTLRFHFYSQGYNPNYISGPEIVADQLLLASSVQLSPLERCTVREDGRFVLLPCSHCLIILTVTVSLFVTMIESLL